MYPCWNNVNKEYFVGCSYSEGSAFQSAFQSQGDKVYFAKMIGSDVVAFVEMDTVSGSKRVIKKLKVYDDKVYIDKGFKAECNNRNEQFNYSWKNHHFCVSGDYIYFGSGDFNIENDVNAVYRLDIGSGAIGRLLRSNDRTNYYGVICFAGSQEHILFEDGNKQYISLFNPGTSTKIGKIDKIYGVTEEGVYGQFDSQAKFYQFGSGQKIPFKKLFDGYKGEEILCVDSKHDVLYYRENDSKLDGRIIGRSRTGNVVDVWESASLLSRDGLHIYDGEYQGYSIETELFDGNNRLFVLRNDDWQKKHILVCDRTGKTWIRYTGAIDTTLYSMHNKFTVVQVIPKYYVNAFFYDYNSGFVFDNANENVFGNAIEQPIHKYVEKTSAQKLEKNDAETTVTLADFRKRVFSCGEHREKCLEFRKALAERWDYNAAVGILVGSKARHTTGDMHTTEQNIGIGQGDNGNNVVKKLQEKGLESIFERYQKNDMVQLLEVENDILRIAPEYKQILDFVKALYL